MTRSVILKTALAAALCLGSRASAHAGQLLVGASKVSITPGAAAFPYLPSSTQSLNLVEGEHSFVGVHDEIYARALVLDDGAHRIALIVLETTAVPEAGDMVRAIAQELKIPDANVMLAATHTHDVPLFSYAGHDPSAREQTEIDRLKQGALEAAREADAHLQPASIAFGRGQSWININNGEQSGSHLGYDPLGPSDKTLDLIRFTSLQGLPIALVVNYSAHAEVMFRSLTRDNGYEVSGDLPGATSRLLETAPKPIPVVLVTSGAEADQISLFKSSQPAGLLPASDQGASGWALLDAQARRLAESVLTTLAAMKAGSTSVQLHAAASSVTCPGQQVRIDPATGQQSVEPKPPVTIPLQVLQINSIVLAGVSGDVATEIGQHFKAASPLPDSMMVTMAGDSVGYIFTDSSYVHPGHGLTKSLLKQGCAEPAIIQRLISLIQTTGTTQK